MEQEQSKPKDSYICWDMAVVVKDLDSTVKRLESMGFGPFFKPDSPPGAEGLFYEDNPLEFEINALVCRIGNMQLEVIQPDEEKPNPWREFLETKGEGIHHVGFQVKNIEKEIERLEAQGGEVTFYGKEYGKIGAAYMDMKVANLIFELTGFNDVAGK